MPLGTHLGSILGGFWVASWTSNPKKIDLEAIKKSTKKSTPLGIHNMDSQEGFGLPKPVKTILPNSYGASWKGSWALLGASWVPLGAKMAPRPLPRLIFLDFGGQLNGFWNPS